MNDWQSTNRGRGALLRDLSGFEIEAFYTYSESERRVIDDERRSSALKLALALQIDFLGMDARLLKALSLVPPVLWRHLGAQDRRAGLGLAAVDHTQEIGRIRNSVGEAD